MANEAPELDQARAAILAATLTHVPFDGWSEAAIAAGIRDAGQRESLSILAFPDGPSSLAQYYSDFADQRMVAALNSDALGNMSIRQRITCAVRLRFDQAEDEREALKALMTWFATPAHQTLGAKSLYQTVDSIWRAIGDTSTDFNFYSKRAILAGVLAATVLYWLGDESKDRADTNAFLDRRIEDVMEIEKVKGRARDWLAGLPDPFRILRDAVGRGGHDNGGAGDGDTPGDGPGPQKP